ncbi:MAG: iron chelate uptake ABC transporter family permease subunit, partial [Campylobacter sp.]|nr:iron chelate uptake ABC transporter family permease subunit [Campylobacter sp.]
MRSTIVLALILLVLSVVSLFVGVLDMDIKSIFNGDIKQLETLFISRLPRLLAIICAGVGLSTAGLLMQQLCMNKFVSPTTGGTIASAQLGILLALVFMPHSSIYARAIFAFFTAMAGTWIYVAFIQTIKFKDTVMVAIVGIMFSYVIGGVTSFLAFKFDLVQTLSTWLTGSFSLVLRGRYEIVYLTIPLFILAFAFANYFNIVGLGREFSKNLGVPYNFVLFGGLSIAAMLTASVVVVVGTISYVGLIVPNLISMFKGDRLQGTLADTALFGAIFVLACDLIGRVLIAPYELPIELIAVVLGSAIF